MTPKKTQVAIIGGVIIGTSLAIALSRSGIEIVLVDRVKPEFILSSQYDGRASAISFASLQLLKSTEIWGEVAQAQPILDIRVSDSNSHLYLHYDHRLLGGEPFGMMVENRHLRLGLSMRAKKEGIETITGSITDLKICDHSATICLENGNQIEASLIIAADGSKSTIRQLAKIGTRGWNYGQTGIVMTVKHEKPHLGIAHERFFPSGPFAILPLTENRSSLVWTEKSELVPKIMNLSQQNFQEELEYKFGSFLGKLTPLEPRWTYNLALQQANKYVSKRLALAGDSAHVMHPIAGQGLNLGFRDVAALAETIVDANRIGLDVGSQFVLKRYQTWRRFDGVTLLAITDSLNRLFSNDIMSVRIARDLGLATVDKITPLKKFFVNHARGTLGNLPKLLTGQNL